MAGFTLQRLVLLPVHGRVKSASLVAFLQHIHNGKSPAGFSLQSLARVKVLNSNYFDFFSSW
jgi:hypothetical protein